MKIIRAYVLSFMISWTVSQCSFFKESNINLHLDRKCLNKTDYVRQISKLICFIHRLHIRRLRKVLHFPGQKQSVILKVSSILRAWRMALPDVSPSKTSSELRSQILNVIETKQVLYLHKYSFNDAPTSYIELNPQCFAGKRRISTSNRFFFQI